MKEIIIPCKKHGPQTVQVDDIDYPHLSKWKWWISDTNGKYLYAWTRYIDPQRPRRRIKMHRILLGLTGRFEYCDHIDRNTLNNQRSNLRIATPAQNAMNRKIRCHSKTGYKGVFFYPENKTNKYYACVAKGGVKYPGGFFRTAEEAALKYNELASEIQGKFANLNVILS